MEFAEGTDERSRPRVSNAGRFFLMGGTTTSLAKAGDEPRFVFTATGTHSYVWWSDDGRTWTRSGSVIEGFGTSIDFGRDGMLLNTDSGMISDPSAASINGFGGFTVLPRGVMLTGVYGAAH